MLISACSLRSCCSRSKHGRLPSTYHNTDSHRLELRRACRYCVWKAEITWCSERYAWPPSTPVIQVTFTFYDESHVPESYTTSDPYTDEIKCAMFFSRKDIENCPDFIRSQFVREITVALRIALITRTCETYHPKERFYQSTPAKHPRQRKFKSRYLYHMTHIENRYHGGYWMEHNLFGGIIDRLSGSFFTNAKNPEGSCFNAKHQDAVVYIKVIATSRYSIYALGRPHYKCMGYVYNTNTRTFGPREEIFHASDVRMCRRDLF